MIKMFFAFAGRIGRISYLLRGMGLGIATGLLSVVGFTLFLHGVLWWLGILIFIAALVALVVSFASLVARRLHDMNFSGYHAIWVAPVQLLGVLVPPALASDGVDISGFDQAIYLLVAAIGACLLLWPGTKEENRFGYRANRRERISQFVLGSEERATKALIDSVAASRRRRRT
jgi:uncharacterized membrane protein YhaH (DUF805 family)